jgi:hypothetical protein
MHSWQALDPVPLKPGGLISTAFIAVGAHEYREAARHIGSLRYGRNSLLEDPLLVLREGRGTCSTKHALLRKLAIEQNIAAMLILGIYEMNERNTPGVGSVLRSHGMVSLPEAHCYLSFNGKRIDATREIATTPQEGIARFLHEEEITPEQIGAYKIGIHRRFLRQWMQQYTAAAAYTFDELWEIREQCIIALSDAEPG